MKYREVYEIQRGAASDTMSRLRLACLLLQLAFIAIHSRSARAGPTYGNGDYNPDGGGFIDEAEKRGDVDADVDNGHLGQPGNVSVQDETKRGDSYMVDDDEMLLSKTQKRFFGRQRPRLGQQFVCPRGFVPPAFFDWRQRLTTVVHDQGNCGSCYAFGATSAIEAQVEIQTGQFTLLSQQQILDCKRWKDGCKGDGVASVYKYIQRTGGIMSAADYPYWNKSRTHGKSRWKWSCKFDRQRVRATVSDYKYLRMDETAMKCMVASMGPVTVTVAVIQEFQTWNFRLNPVFSHPNCNSESYHCMTVMGYGHDAHTGKNYWIVKNSWGANWGFRGYGKIERGNNMCGIASWVTAPVAAAVPGG